MAVVGWIRDRFLDLHFGAVEFRFLLASVRGGPTHSQVNWWYLPLFLLLRSYSCIARLSRSTISSRVSGTAGGVGSVSRVHQLRIQALFWRFIFLDQDRCVGYGYLCGNDRAALCVLAIRKTVLLGLGHRYLNWCFLSAFQQSAGLITCRITRLRAEESWERYRYIRQSYVEIAIVLMLWFYLS